MTELDPERQRQAKQYARIRRRLWLVDTIFSGLYALAWLFFGWAFALRTWLNQFIQNEWILVPLFVAVFGGIYTILNLPLGYYSGFVLPHRFGQSNQSFRDWVIDISSRIGSVIPPLDRVARPPGRRLQPVHTFLQPDFLGGPLRELAPALPRRDRLVEPAAAACAVPSRRRAEANAGSRRSASKNASSASE